MSKIVLSLSFDMEEEKDIALYEAVQGVILGKKTETPKKSKKANLVVDESTNNQAPEKEMVAYAAEEGTTIKEADKSVEEDNAHEEEVIEKDEWESKTAGEIRAAVQEQIDNNLQAVKSIVSEFGCNNINELDPKDYGTFVAKCKNIKEV